MIAEQRVRLRGIDPIWNIQEWAPCMIGADSTDMGTIYFAIMDRNRALIWNEFHIKGFPNENRTPVYWGKEIPERLGFPIRNRKLRATRVLGEQLAQSL